MKCKFTRAGENNEWVEVECFVNGTYPNFELSLNYSVHDPKVFGLNDGNFHNDNVVKDIKILASKFWFDCMAHSKIFVIEGIAEVNGKLFNESFHLTVL